MSNLNLILASSSPRRIELLKKGGYDPVIIPPQVTENLPDGIGPKDAVLFLALKKALAVEAVVLKGDAIIIAADTVVYLDEIIGKPETQEDAFAILTKLRGKPHQVMSGVAILKAGTDEKEVFCETSTVYFKEYTDGEIMAYIRTPEPYDKAGAYAIQGGWGKYVDRVEGDYHNIMGLPLERTLAVLERFAE